MARKPDVFVRALTSEEGRKLAQIGRRSNRVLDLYDNPPADGWVVSVGEFGPLNLMPRTGRGWARAGRPKRLRATYNRHDGVRHMDLLTVQLYYRIRDRKRAVEFLAFVKSLRARWPGERLYLVPGNYSVHKRREVREWCTGNEVEWCSCRLIRRG